MFAGIISREEGCPWPDTGIGSTADWIEKVPVRRVSIRRLIACQPGVFLHALAEDFGAPVGGDPYPHVISWEGRLYLEDGHHRVVRAALSGRRTVQARVRHIEVPAPS